MPIEQKTLHSILTELAYDVMEQEKFVNGMKVNLLGMKILV